MKTNRLIAALAAILLVAGVASAQNDSPRKRKPLPPEEQSQYVVSAKSGVVNVVEGEVSARGEKPDWNKLTAGDELHKGDTIRTGADGRVEVLLNPGNYLRVGEDSEVVYDTDAADGVRLNIARGSVIVEAAVVDSWIMVVTPKARLALIREGLYRVNVGPDGRSEIAISKGKVFYGLLPAKNFVIKDGKKVVADGNTLAVTAFNKNVGDGFDLWSRGRARTLIAANKSLSNRMLRRSGLLSWSSGNLWVYDMRCGCHTFLPGGWGFSSPYGWGYSVCNPYYPGWWQQSWPRRGGETGGSTIGGSPGGYPGGSPTGTPGGMPGGGARPMPMPTGPSVGGPGGRVDSVGRDAPHPGSSGPGRGRMP